MTLKNYKVGYGKPPLETRFKKGVCPNPAGRGHKQKSSELSQIEQILYEPVYLGKNSKGKKLTHAQMAVKTLIISALQGNAVDALRLLRLYRHTSASVKGELVIHVEGGPSSGLRFFGSS